MVRNFEGFLIVIPKGGRDSSSQFFKKQCILPSIGELASFPSITDHLSHQLLLVRPSTNKSQADNIVSTSISQKGLQPINVHTIT